MLIQTLFTFCKHTFEFWYKFNNNCRKYLFIKTYRIPVFIRIPRDDLQCSGILNQIYLWHSTICLLICFTIYAVNVGIRIIKTISSVC